MKILSHSEIIKQNLICKVRSGSHSYGTNIASSDEDYRGIFIADPIHILTPFYGIKEASDTNEEDTKFYEIRNFMQLYLNANPNILELLWVDETDIIFTTPQYEYLREVREKLLSSRVAFTFTGYAVSQLRRIKGHNKWINNPKPETPPKQSSYLSMVQWFGKEKLLKLDITSFKGNHRLVPYGNEIYGVYPAIGYELYTDDYYLNTNFDGKREELGYPLFIVKYNKEEYKKELDEWNNYWTWKRNRNAVRSELEEKYGFDCKHASHLVRLLRMGKEILETGKLLVKRPDAKELLAIRNGKMSYNKILKYAEEMDEYIRNDLYHKTSLPNKPDMELAVSVLMNIQKEFWVNGGLF